MGRHHKQAEKEGSPAPATPSEQGNKADKKQKKRAKRVGTAAWQEQQQTPNTATGTSHLRSSRQRLEIAAQRKRARATTTSKPGSCPGQPVPRRGAALMGGDPDRRGLAQAGCSNMAPQSPRSQVPHPPARLRCPQHRSWGEHVWSMPPPPVAQSELEARIGLAIARFLRVSGTAQRGRLRARPALDASVQVACAHGGSGSPGRPAV